MSSQDLQPAGSAEWIAVCRDEAGTLLEGQRTALAQSIQVFTVGGALLAAAAAYGVAQKHAEILLALPPLLGFLATYLLQVYGDAKAMGQARRHLEDVVNAELGRPCLIYNTIVAPTRTRETDSSHIPSYALWALAYLAIGAACILLPALPDAHATEYRAGAGLLTLGVTVAAIKAFHAKDLVAAKVTVRWNDASETLRPSTEA